MPTWLHLSRQYVQQAFASVRMAGLVVLCALACLSPQSGAAASETLVASLAYIKDDGGSKTFNDILALEPTPFQGILHQGYSGAVFWIRVTLRPLAKPDSLVLEIRPHYLEEIALYDPQTPDLAPQMAGMAHPWRDDALKSLSQNFTVDGSPTARTYWLRIRSNSTILVDVQASRTDAAARMAMWSETLLGAYLGVLATFTLLGAATAFTSRFLLVRLFPLDQISALVFTIAFTGYTRPLLSSVLDPQWQLLLFRVIIIAGTAIAAAFHIYLLKISGMSRTLFRALLCFLALAPVEMVLLFAGYPRQAMASNAVFAATAMVLLLVAACSIPSTRALTPNSMNLPKPLLIASYAIILLTLGVTQLSVLGVSSNVAIFLNTLGLHGFLSGVLMFLILAWRLRQIHLANAAVAIRLAVSESALTAEKKRSEEQERFVAMLAHELKTPLSTIRVATGRAQVSVDSINRAVSEMDGVISRTAYMSAFEHGKISLHRLPCGVDAELAAAAAASPAAGRIHLDIAAPIHIETDAILLRVILNNLLDNASRYSARGSAISACLVADQKENGCLLSVANLPGEAGWPDEDLLFSKFYRGAHAARQTGAGLGLYVIFGLATRLGGVLRYAPTPTHVRFELWIPA